MKKIATLIILSILTLNTITVSAQKTTNVATVIIKTSSICGMCKASIEKTMAYEKGVISSNLVIKTGELTVKYKPTKTTPEKIRKAISESGYDADTLKAIKKAYNNLPNCCKKGGMEH